MTSVQASQFLSETYPERVRTGAAEDSSSSQDVRDAWNQTIDKLIEWGNDPDQLEDEGVEPPSGEIISKAFLRARDLRDNGLPAPDAALPDPNGGILFEWRDGKTTQIFHIWDDGDLEYRRFDGEALVERHFASAS